MGKSKTQTETTTTHQGTKWFAEGRHAKFKTQLYHLLYE